MIEHHLLIETMTPGEASKLRGIVMWLDTGLMGRPCGGALTALVARQYWEWAPQHVLTHHLSIALHYIHLAAATIPPRVIPIEEGDEGQVLLYTDAATHAPGLRIGILIVEQNTQPICSTFDVPDAVISTWRYRTTYIGQGELLAGPLALWLHADRLRGRDVTWYVDNISAASALIKGASPQADSSEMALVASLQAASLGTRLWFEWIQSDQNPSDPLSRLGLEDPNVRAKLNKGTWRAYQPSVPWEEVLPKPSSLVKQRWEKERWATLEERSAWQP